MLQIKNLRRKIIWKTTTLKILPEETPRNHDTNIFIQYKTVLLIKLLKYKIFIKKS